MGSLRFLVYVSLAAAALGAERSSPLTDLANRAHSAPPEFAADALLRIATTARNVTPAWRAQLVEDAFRIAVSAQQPYARRAWMRTRGGPAEKAYELGLDACTLECRAVRVMLALDRKKARELFEQIPAPAIPRLTCEDAFVYDVSVFYATLANVAQQAFSPKEIAEQAPLHLLERYAPDVNSPVQAGPIASMLASGPVPAAQLQGLADGFASALQQLSGDGRSFSATIADQSDAASVEALASTGGKQKSNALAVLSAWRSYLTRHLSGSVCSDVAGASAVRFFNENMRIGALSAISDQEAQPGKLDSQAHVPGSCDSPECRQLSTQFSGLLLGPVGMAYGEEDKASPEWTAKLKDFMDALNNWKSGDNHDEYFLWKSRFYSDLFHVLPGGPNRDLVLNAFLGWLEQNEYQRDHRVEWFYRVNALIVSAFGDPVAMKATMRELRNSADPVIALYAELERVLPRPFESTVSLL